MTRRKKRRPNSEVSLSQLQHMGNRPSFRSEPKIVFKKEPGCISSDAEVPTYFDKTTYKGAGRKRGKYKDKE